LLGQVKWQFLSLQLKGTKAQNKGGNSSSCGWDDTTSDA